jgi:pyruvate dehydrogenase E2 component (dihydrolipoamide acetyltransferase)
VRELAKRLEIDIAQVSGTGPEGRVMRRDVEAFCEEIKRGGPVHTATRVAPQEPVRRDEPDWTRRPLRGVRRLVAERMVRSKATIPHYTFVEEVDVTVLEDRRKAFAEAAGQETVSPLAFIARAAVRVLPHYPQMNACLDEETGEMIFKGKIHLGIAVATEEGLMVPVIRDAAGRDVAELAATIRELSDRARAKTLDPSELKGATFTITSLGKLGGLMATPIINYPASAILGVHAIRTLPRYVGSQVEPRKMLNLSVSLDHRIVDGFEGARFVQDVKEILEQADFPDFK